MTGKIKGIYIAKTGQPPLSKSSAQVKANKGIVGDRYYDGTGTFSGQLTGNRKSEITFIASEEIDQFNTSQNESMGYGDMRRNIVTEGIKLKDLIGKEFEIGTATFLGIEHCEPCAHLAATVNKKVLPHMVNTGLRAAILNSGLIAVGSEISDA